MKVTINKIPRPIEFDPEIVVEYECRGATQAEVTWQNPDTMQALRALFALRKGERIGTIVVTKRGIRAEIISG